MSVLFKFCLPVHEFRVQSLSWEDPLKKEMATHSSIFAWGVPWTETSMVGYILWGRRESDTTERLNNSIVVAVQ